MNNKYIQRNVIEFKHGEVSESSSRSGQEDLSEQFDSEPEPTLDGKVQVETLPVLFRPRLTWADPE